MHARFVAVIGLASLLMFGLFLGSLLPELSLDSLTLAGSPGASSAGKPEPASEGSSGGASSVAPVVEALPASPPAPLLPNDSGGEAVSRLVAGEASLPPPGQLDFVTLVQPARDLSPRMATPERLSKPAGPRPVRLPPPPPMKPVSTAEPLPLAAETPVRAQLPGGPPVVMKPRELSPSPPPGLPISQPPKDFKPSNDFTDQAVQQALIHRPLILRLTAAPFVRVGLPDPFLLAEQIRDRLDPTLEPPVAPIIVNPKRPR